MKAHVTPRALETDEIPGIVEDYRRAAENAKRAGFDGVEVHSANNYLLEQFVRDSTNTRTDAYGGSIENRLRFPLAVVKAVDRGLGRGATASASACRPPRPSRARRRSTAIRTRPSAPMSTRCRSSACSTSTRSRASPSRPATSRRASTSSTCASASRAPMSATTSSTLELCRDGTRRGPCRPVLLRPPLYRQPRPRRAPRARARRWPRRRSPHWYGGGATGYSDWPGMNGPVPIRR